MNKDLIFKTIALGAMVVGGISIANATATRIRRERIEEETADTLIEADVISEELSSMVGRKRRLKSSELTKHGFGGRRRLKSNELTNRVKRGWLRRVFTNDNVSKYTPCPAGYHWSSTDQLCVRERVEDSSKAVV